jgi:hypothetical protein
LFEFVYSLLIIVVFPFFCLCVCCQKLSQIYRFECWMNWVVTSVLFGFCVFSLSFTHSLIHSDVQQHVLLHEVMLTYHSFCNSRELLNALIKRSLFFSSNSLCVSLSHIPHISEWTRLRWTEKLNDVLTCVCLCAQIWDCTWGSWTQSDSFEVSMREFLQVRIFNSDLPFRFVSSSLLKHTTTTRIISLCVCFELFSLVLSLSYTCAPLSFSLFSQSVQCFETLGR